MKNLIKRWLGITPLEKELVSLRVKHHKLLCDFNKLQSLVTALEKIDVDANILGDRGRNTLILTGQFRGRGYVRFYDMSNDEFAEWVERARYEHKGGLIRNTDYPPQMSAFFNW